MDMSQTQSKKEKKQKPPTGPRSLKEIMAGVNKFKSEILEEKESSDFDFPYRIPFSHQGLQAITGGIIGGKMAEISGDSQTGKSFLLYELIASVQKMGGYAQLYDLEQAFENAYAKIVGIDLTSGTLSIEHNPDLGNFFSSSMVFITNIRDFEKTNKLPRAPILIGLDSFPGLQTAVDLKNMEDGKDLRGYAAMQKNAAFSQQIDKFVQFLSEYDATFVMLNQVRKDHSIEFGDKTVTPAETVIKFWCTQRIRGKLSKKIVKIVPSLEYKNGQKLTIGSSVIWETIKNRSVKPFQKVLAKFRYASGMDMYSGLDELLYAGGKIVPGTTTKTKEGETVKKPIKGFRVKDVFFYSMKELVEAHPELLTPAWTGTYDDGEGIEDKEPDNDELDV